MSELNNVVLKDFKSTANEKTFVVELEKNSTRLSKTYFANIEKDDETFDRKSKANMSCFKTTDNVVVHNIYDSEKILFHHLAARRHRYPYVDYYDFQHIYKSITDEQGHNLSSGISSIVQASNNFYGLGPLTQYGHYYVNDEVYDWLARDNEYAFPVTSRIKTLTYDVDKINDGNIDDAVSTVIDGVEYNTIYEIPGTIQQNYFSGSLYGTTVKGKNQYDKQYSMQHDTDNVLSHARNYYEICNCNDLVYLKYFDNVSYKSSSSSQPIDSTKTFKTVEDPVVSPSTAPIDKIPQIEVLENINRGASTSNHKSTMYSLRLRSNIFNYSSLKNNGNKKIKDNIKNEIRNYVHSLVEKLAPANTQLFTISIS